MMIPRRYIRMFISWLSRIFKETTLRSYRTFLAVFRLFQRYCVVSSGKGVREHGLALSSQPPNIAVTLAVPDSQPGRSIQFPAPQQVLGIELGVDHALKSWDDSTSVVSDVKLTPIIPSQINRYERNKLMYVILPLSLFHCDGSTLCSQ